MSKMSQVYGIGQAIIPVLPPPLPFENAPTIHQTNYEIGQIVFTPPRAPTAFYIYAGNGSWDTLNIGASGIASVLGTTNQITSSTISGVATLSIPTTFIAPGTIEAVSSVTAGNGLTATTGDLNLNATASGFLTKPTVTSGAASGPVTCDGRIGAVTFTGTSIAAGASETFVMSNTKVKGSGTSILYTFTGVTTGAAIGISSVTNSAGSSSIVVTNGTGATTQSDDITFTFLILN